VEKDNPGQTLVQQMGSPAFDMAKAMAPASSHWVNAHRDMSLPIVRVVVLYEEGMARVPDKAGLENWHVGVVAVVVVAAAVVARHSREIDGVGTQEDSRVSHIVPGFVTDAREAVAGVGL
jgi:hypothetical protein